RYTVECRSHPRVTPRLFGKLRFSSGLAFTHLLGQVNSLTIVQAFLLRSPRPIPCAGVGPMDAAGPPKPSSPGFSPALAPPRAIHRGAPDPTPPRARYPAKTPATQVLRCAPASGSPAQRRPSRSAIAGDWPRRAQQEITNASYRFRHPPERRLVQGS